MQHPHFASGRQHFLRWKFKRVAPARQRLGNDLDPRRISLDDQLAVQRRDDLAAACMYAGADDLQVDRPGRRDALDLGAAVSRETLGNTPLKRYMPLADLAKLTGGRSSLLAKRLAPVGVIPGRATADGAQRGALVKLTDVAALAIAAAKAGRLELRDGRAGRPMPSRGRTPREGNWRWVGRYHASTVGVFLVLCEYWHCRRPTSRAIAWSTKRFAPAAEQKLPALRSAAVAAARPVGTAPCSSSLIPSSSKHRKARAS